MRAFSIFCFTSFYLCAFSTSLEVRGGYFFPQEKLLRDIYNNGGWEPAAEVRFRFYDRFEAWASFSAFLKNGRSVGLKTPTFIQIYPLSVGVNYSWELLRFLDLYVGVGGVVTWLVITDHSPYVRGSIFKTGGGVTSKTGLMYYFFKKMFLDFYADYSYMYVGSFSQEGVETYSQNVGGLRVGIGLGGTF